MKAFAWLMITSVVVITLIANAGYGSLFGFVNSVPGADLTLHFGLYALLSLAVVSWLSQRFTSRRARALVISVLVVLVTLEELSQSLFASRNFSLMDLSFSIAGLLVGAAVAFWWTSRTP